MSPEHYKIRASIAHSLRIHHINLLQNQIMSGVYLVAFVATIVKILV